MLSFFFNIWLSVNTKFTIRNNFITYNAHSCIDWNGHALILFLFIMRDQVQNGSDLFVPRLLGSQSCEQAFRAVRSMTGSFSTIINFSILGLLRCLHPLQVQLELEAKMKETGIQYPRVEAHMKKIGFSSLKETMDLKSISDQDILDAVNDAKNEAANAIRELGMDFTDKELEEIISKPLDETEDHDDDDDDEDDDDNDGNGTEEAYTKEETFLIRKTYLKISQ